MVPGKERTTGSHVALMQGSPWASNSWQFAHSCRALSDRKADWICALLLVFIWVLAALLVNPVGDFPLNDDWAYGFAVRSLVETGHLRLSGWTATNLIAQVPWGALFCLPFGFSFTALRLSTLVLGLIGVLATYGLLREARASAWLALFGSLVLAFSPIYFALSYTFMTDVPFTAVATASSWLLLRGLRRDSWFEMGGGTYPSCGCNSDPPSWPSDTHCLRRLLLGQVWVQYAAPDRGAVSSGHWIRAPSRL